MYAQLTRQILTVLAILCLAAPSMAGEGSAPEETAASSRVTIDVEIDPIAYALQGHSLHLGIGIDSLRIDLGAFGAVLPQFLHGNEGFENSFSGFGTKLDLFLLGGQLGPFVGVEAALTRMTVLEEQSQQAKISTQFQAGLRVGWRIGLPADFFLSPWLGVGYNFQAGEQTVGDRTFSQSALVFFPTLHLGYRF